MKFLGTTLFASAILATTTLAISSEPLGDIHAPSVRRSMHHQSKRSKCAAGSHKKSGKKSKSKSKSSSGGSSSGDSGSGSGSSDKASSNNDNSSSSSSSSSDSGSVASTGGSTGSGRDLKLKGKQGLAWPNSNGMNIDNFFMGGVSWYYSWAAWPLWNDAPVDDDHVFCPMYWGDGGSGGNRDEFKKRVTNDPNNKFNKAKCAMGPNEVNQKGQADMSPQAVCSGMKELIMPLAEKGWYIMGPSTTSAPNGLSEWYPEFKKVCPDVFERLDAIPLHYYDVSIEKFKSYVENWHTKMGKDIWITEFACQNFNGGAQCSQDDTNQMMKEMTDWFLKQDYVKGFSPFGTMQNLQGVSQTNRLSQGSNPTALFRTFATAK